MDNHFKRDCLLVLKDKMAAGTIDRRTFLTGLVALGAYSAMGAPGLKAAEGELVVANWGGDAVPAFKSAFAGGFGESAGKSVKIDGSGPTKGAMRAQFESGAVRWDVCDADPGSTKALGQNGMIEQVDYAIVDKAKIEDGFAFEFSPANYFFSYVITYDAKKFAGDPPKSWADFWDVKKYPGKRTMFKWMSGSLEAALMADGVPADKLYPLDMDRAFKKLEELKPHVVSYWDSGAESQQLMRDGEASMGILWHTRANLVETDTGGDVSWTYAQGIMAASGWTVIKGNPAGKEAAMQFIAYCQDPARQVALLEALGSAPANPAAHAMVSDTFKRLDCSSPENRALQVAMDAEWYAANSDKALERYLAMVAQ